MGSRQLLKTVLVVFSLGLLLSSCTRIGLAYRNLDSLVPWWLNSYIDLDSEQKRWFDQRLAGHLEWHCRTQLPLYIDWLDRTDRLVENGQPSTAQLSVLMDEARAAQQRIAEQISPSLIELLQDLSPEQVAQLRSELDEKTLELQKKYTQPPLVEQISERSKRLEKRLKPWFGDLSAEQQARIQSWSVAQGEQNSLWLDDRARWQGELFSALDERQASTFAPRLSRLLHQPESLQDATYRQAFQRSRDALTALFSDLLASAQPQQRSHLQKRLREVRDDFNKSRCDASPVSG